MSNQPFFSIVMASYLDEYGGNYGRSATDRVAKFHRAVRSVLAQTFEDWELLIVADGCELTTEEGLEYAEVTKVRRLYIEKQRLWSGKVRNAGIYKATGRYIVYLDTDDELGIGHLAHLRERLALHDLPRWAYFDDLVWNPATAEWQQRIARIDKKHGSGTSNLAHRRDIGAYWPDVVYRWPSMGYDHDEQFLQVLKTDSPGVGIGRGYYKVCHIPKQYEV